MRKFRSLVGSVVLAALASLSHAALTVNDPGFEGDGSAWGVPNGAATIVGSSATPLGLSSDKSLQFKSTAVDGGSGSASQDVVLPLFFHFEFWTLSRGALPAGFTAKLSSTDGPPATSVFDLLSFNSDTSGSWTKWFGDVDTKGLDGDYTLEFAVAATSPFDVRVDNVSLVDCGPTACVPDNGGGGNNNVPEPGSLFLVGAALVAGGLARRRIAKV